MPLSTHNGFSEEEINQCKGWLLPEVSNGGTIPATVDKKKEKSLKHKKSQKEQKSDENKKESIELIEDVDLDADTIKENSQSISAEQLEKITQDAEKEGYQAGFDKGFAEGEEEGLRSGLAESKQTIADQSQRLQHVIDALLTPIENEKKQIEQLLVDMTCRLTETLLERELKTDSEAITGLIDSILTLLPQSTPAFTLFLNPDDIELVETHLEQKLISGTSDNALQYKLKEDKTLMRGGCRLESNQTSIDASMETKLKKLLSDFVSKRHEKNIENPDHNQQKATKNDEPEKNSDADENDE